MHTALCERIARAATMLVLCLLLPRPCFADSATDIPPLIGKLQTVRWNGTTASNVALDGTLECAAFGGPENIPPPPPFDGFFSLVGGQYRPTTVDPDVGVPAPSEADRDRNWIYAYRLINDEGDDGVEGGAIIIAINIALPTETASLQNAFVQSGVSGSLITEYGATATELVDPNDPDPDDITVNFSGIAAIQRFFFLTITRLVLQPASSSNFNTSEVFFFYSPFSPSNCQASFIGQATGQSAAHTVGNVVIVPQFFPHVTCVLEHVGTTAPPGETDYELRCRVLSETRSLDATSVDSLEAGNVLQVFDPGTGPRPVADRVRLTVSASEPTTPCIFFRVAEVDRTDPVSGTVLVGRDGALDVPLSVVRLDGCGTRPTLRPGSR